MIRLLIAIIMFASVSQAAEWVEFERIDRGYVDSRGRPLSSIEGLQGSEFDHLGYDDPDVYVKWTDDVVREWREGNKRYLLMGNPDAVITPGNAKYKIKKKNPKKIPNTSISGVTR